MRMFEASPLSWRVAQLVAQPELLVLPPHCITAADMRNMGMFEASSPGVGGADDEEEAPEAAADRYPPLPQRSYKLAQLLQLAGLEEQVRCWFGNTLGLCCAPRGCVPA